MRFENVVTLGSVIHLVAIVSCLLVLSQALFARLAIFEKKQDAFMEFFLKAGIPKKKPAK